MLMAADTSTVLQTVSARDNHFRWSLVWQAGLVSSSQAKRTFADLDFGATLDGVDLKAVISDRETGM